MILLTGASGYLGRHVETLLRARGLPYATTGRSGTVDEPCDLTDATSVVAMLRRVHPKVIVHCAAKVPRCPADYDNLTDAAASYAMVQMLVRYALCPIVFASSQTAVAPTHAYGRGKIAAELAFLEQRDGQDTILRLPGLFGLPRRSGVIYHACQHGHIPESFGPYPAMHVRDAATYLVRAATLPNDGNPEPFTVTYSDPRVTSVYGSLGVTFDERVQQFKDELAREQVGA